MIVFKNVLESIAGIVSRCCHKLFSGRQTLKAVFIIEYLHTFEVQMQGKTVACSLKKYHFGSNKYFAEWRSIAATGMLLLCHVGNSASPADEIFSCPTNAWASCGGFFTPSLKARQNEIPLSRQRAGKLGKIS